VKYSSLFLFPLGSLIWACPTPSACQNGVIEAGELCFSQPTIVDEGRFRDQLGITAADINKDGSIDLVTCNDPDNIRVNLGNGDGTFQPPKITQVSGLAPVQVAVGDLNGDQELDLVTANFFSNDVSILLGNGDGTFGLSTTIGVSADPLTGSTPFSLALGDLNLDSKLDLVVAEVSGGNTLDVFLGNGDGTFQTPTSFTVDRLGNVLINDLNRDQQLDLITTSGSSLVVFLGTGDGSFQPPQLFFLADGAFGLALADLNGDTFLDVASANFGAEQGDLSTFSAAFGNGDGTFNAPSTNSVLLSGAAAVYANATDVNQDGAVDLLMSSLDGATLDLALNQGDGTFAAPRLIANGTTFLREVASADFNEDGAADLAIASPGDGILLLLSQP
jgi:hypothetical protein